MPRLNFRPCPRSRILSPPSVHHLARKESKPQINSLSVGLVRKHRPLTPDSGPVYTASPFAFPPEGTQDADGKLLRLPKLRGRALSPPSAAALGDRCPLNTQPSPALPSGGAALTVPVPPGRPLLGSGSGSGLARTARNVHPSPSLSNLLALRGSPGATDWVPVSSPPRYSASPPHHGALRQALRSSSYPGVLRGALMEAAALASARSFGAESAALGVGVWGGPS